MKKLLNILVLNILYISSCSYANSDIKNPFIGFWKSNWEKTKKFIPQEFDEETRHYLEVANSDELSEIHVTRDRWITRRNGFKSYHNYKIIKNDGNCYILEITGKQTDPTQVKTCFEKNEMHLHIVNSDSGFLTVYEPSSIFIAKTLKKDLENVFSAVTTADIDALISHFPPQFINALAAMTNTKSEILIEQMKKEFSNKASLQKHPTTVLNHRVSQISNQDDEVFAIVKYGTSVVISDDENLIEHGYLLAWKPKVSKKWFFLLGDSLKEENIKYYFKNYKGGLNFPEYRRCVNKC